MSFSQKWSQVQHELLDLTFRNPLLNYRPLKSRGLEFETLPLAPLLARLEGEKAVRFAIQNQKISTGVLPTAYTQEELDKRLLKTFYDARSSLEEQGVNTLFLAFGFLKWFESPDSEVARRSPLWLLPVELKREKAGGGFELRATGENGELNLCLATLWRRDFRLELPPIETDEFDWPLYLNRLQDALTAFPRFEIEENLALAFFSFSKFLMLRDLEAQTQNAHNHPVLAALLERGFHEAPSPFCDSQKLDEALPSKESQLVSDADSSQMLAVEDVKRGRNLVIQGPPGTGKSQTITNIIAQAIARGQKVLFVSEKMAALGVVKSRLDALGLGGACLELHSNKTNKKSLLNELLATYEMPRPRAAAKREAAQTLDEIVRRLNLHSHAVNSPIQKSGLCLHQIYGFWLQNEAQIAAQSLVLPRVDEGVLAEKTPEEIARLRSLLGQMQSVLGRTGPLQNHPFGGAKIRVFLPLDARNLRENLLELRDCISQLRAQSQNLALVLQHPSPTQNSQIGPLLEAANLWKIAPDLVGVDRQNAAWLERQSQWKTLLESAKTLLKLKSKWENQLQNAAWTADVAPLQNALRAHGGKWFRFLIGDWRKTQKTLQTLTASPPPKDPSAQLQILEAIQSFQLHRARFAATRDLAKALFGEKWRDLNSDFDELERIAFWLETAHGKMRARGLCPEFWNVQTAPNAHNLETNLAELLAKIGKLETEVARLLDWPVQAPPEWTEWQNQLEWRAQNVEKLGEIAALNALSESLDEQGLSAFDELARSWPDAARGLRQAFERAFLESLLRAAATQFPHLNGFDGAAHEKLAREFAQHDRAFLGQTARATALAHFERIAALDNEKELKILRREWQKQRAHLAPRRLISLVPHTLQTLKPVLMMSPLSVAAYLPISELKFDLVVFDEASQVRPVEAFGALLRGAQAVVSGDSKQLPPTSFFDKYLAQDEDDDTDEGEMNVQDVESVLGLFVAQGAPQRMLRWHYRSRHESLIATSNREFYDDKLIVFPSPDAARADMGLVCHLLPHTVYNASINREEAKAVAQAVMNHAQNWLETAPESRRSLGVAAFSVKQAQEIQDQLETLRRQNEALEAFFALENCDPFFVKNLENVQGDERDVMFLSVGYGRDENGKIAQRFGPLGNAGGERRLNVLISRARLRCEVFTNLRADDIDLTRAKGLGVRALKQFLAYAQTGVFAVSLPSHREMDSPFEEDVFAAISQLGYEAVPQVGCAGYFLDLCIRDPRAPGRFVLGIECDGAAYHSAASARDRDRLRAQVLENMGWKLHRIWSTDWFRNRAAQVERLKIAIEAAVA